MNKTFIKTGLLLLSTIVIIILSGCTREQNPKQESIPPCYTNDFESIRNPYLGDETQKTEKEKVGSSEYVAIVKITDFDSQTIDSYGNEVTVFNVQTLSNFKGELEDNTILDARVKCVLYEELEEYAYLSTYSISLNPDDYFRIGNYYLVLLTEREDNTLYTLYYKELPKYNEYRTYEEQEQELKDIIDPYISEIS